LKLIPIDDLKKENGDGAYLPTEENIKTGKYQPLSRIEFLYINSKSAEKEVVKKFINYYLASAARLSKETGSVPLQSDLYSDIMLRFNKNIKGTILNDDELLNVNTLQKELKIKNAKGL
jgi:phosphate transport system substrate-binding protein